MKNLKLYAILCRVPVAFFVACSAVTGFFLASPRPDWAAAATAAGIFFLACGASALNQYQEREIDALMERTKSRPLPSGALTPRHALSVSLVLIASGLACVAIDGTLPLLLGFLAVLWYNGAYTYLKRVTAFAAVPGALIGAVPPAIGWVSGKGPLLDFRLAGLCALFFLWQIPHFWLLLIACGDEYRRAGLPSITGKIPRARLARITFTWTAAAAAALLLLPLFRLMHSLIIVSLLTAGALWISINGRQILGEARDGAAARSAFRSINGFLFVIMIFLTLDSLLGRG